MKYLCLIYFDEAKLAAVPAESLPPSSTSA